MWSEATVMARMPTINTVMMNAMRALRSEERCTFCSITVTVPDLPKPKPRLDLDMTRPPCQGWMGWEGVGSAGW